MQSKSICCLLEKPNPRQKEFLLAQSRFVAYGGARGGGKSWAVRQKAKLAALYYPGIRMLLLRRSYPELRENHILPLQSELKGIARWKEGEKSFVFPGGSRLKFGYCDNDGDVLRYQGQEYDLIFMDEATQFTEYQFGVLTACLRGANNFPKRMYLTCNPGGVGHQWVKRLFVDRQYKPAETPADYTFIPARVYDNKVLMKRDPGYAAMLEQLEPDLKRAWLEGDWDLTAGQYFSCFRREIHVRTPFAIPEHWRRYITLDYGLDMLACYWVAVDQEGRAYVYRELYRPDLIISRAAELIKAMTLPGERIYARMAPPDLWNRRQDTGRSVAEVFAAEGLPLTKASNNRVMGWYDLQEWLRVRETGGQRLPGLQIFDCCPNLIRTLPALQRDPCDPNDCAVTPHELTHAPDALRHFAAGRPCPGMQKQAGTASFFEAGKPRFDPTGRGESCRII